MTPAPLDHREFGRRVRRLYRRALFRLRLHLGAWGCNRWDCDPELPRYYACPWCGLVKGRDDP